MSIHIENNKKKRLISWNCGQILNSSFIPKIVPAPISRSIYSSVQRGEDIPYEGLMPYLRPKDIRKPLSDSRDNVQIEQVNLF
jgi:hypothetical protein